MESKRKMPVADDGIQRDPKRLKSEYSNHPLIVDGESAESTTEYGMKLLDQVKRAQDKSKRLVATAFLKLPTKREAPDYYDVIKLPVAIDTIELKLSRREFPNLTALESYVKRMIDNAKHYNEPASLIFQDAERLRKLLVAFMKENNPAYKIDPNYVPKATEVPHDAGLDKAPPDSDVDAEGELDIEPALVEPAPAAAAAPPPSRPRGRPRGSLNRVGGRSSATPASENRYTGPGYAGLTFQQAQEKILYDLQEQVSPQTNEPKFEVFIELPPRALKDYYKVIPNPASLKSLLKVVKGGREGVSPFRSWKAYEDEISLVWKNAFHYNEDGSEIHNLAKQLQATFYARLTEAKQEVVEPSQAPKIKLRVGPGPDTGGHQKITLRMSGKASPGASPAPQTQNFPSSANGFADKLTINGSQQKQLAAFQSSTPAPNFGTPNRAISQAASTASPALPPVVPLKHEEIAQRPSSSGILPVQNGQHQSFVQNIPAGNIMPPPSNPGILNFYTAAQYGQNAYGQNSQNQDAFLGLESKWRSAGKGSSDALISKLNIATHPDLNIPRHFRMDVLPSPKMTHQSVTISLPSTHYYIQLIPTVAPHVVTRQHKLFLTVNGTRLHAVPKQQGGGAIDKDQQAFITRLNPGVNRIEVEVIVALPKGATKATESDVELEKISVFANLLPK